MSGDLPDTIVCVDCGGTAHRLTPPFEDGDSPGDVVAYRCADCWDRWDLVAGDPDDGEPTDGFATGPSS